MLKDSRSRTHFFAFILIVFFVSVIGGVVWYVVAQYGDDVAQKYVRTNDLAEQNTASSSESAEVYLSFVGDIMMDRGVKGKVNRFGQGDYRFVFAYADFLKEPDLMFANLEGPVSDRGANVGSIYSFRFEPVVLDVLKEAGFDVLTMANNHAGDWGRLALEDTLTLGRERGLGMVGGGFGYEDAARPVVYEVNGVRVGYLGFSDFGPPSIILSAPISSVTSVTSTTSRAAPKNAGILSADDPFVPAIIADAATQVDILVVSFHFGEEYKPLSSARQQRLARAAIDAGADIVAGHHPHVEQETEEYGKGLIAYSLGNFVFDQYFSKETMRGMKLDVMVTREGIRSYSTSTIYMNSNYQPSMME